MSLERIAFWLGSSAVVLAAVAGVFGAVAWYIQDKVSAGKEAALARFQTESKAKIAEADARSAEANTKAAEAARGTAKALADAAALNERAGKLELEAAQQRERAANAERQLLEVKQRTEPRRLSPDQRAMIVSALRPYAGTTLNISRLGDAEASMFADDVINALKAAGWSFPRMTQIGTMAVPQYGLLLSFAGTAPSPPMAALMSALGKAGILIVGRGPAPEDALLIGLKPVPK